MNETDQMYRKTKTIDNLMTGGNTIILGTGKP
jgi:hypothetical protein